jgi:ribosomal protein L40E
MEKQEHQVITRQLVSNQHKKFCRHCGAKMPVDALQCIKCQSTTVSQRSRSNTMTRYSNGLTQREISGPQKSGQTWNTVKKALKYTAMAILFVLSVIGLLSGRRRTRRLF